MRTSRSILRWALTGLLLGAGVGHLVATEEFLGQVPSWLPWREAIVVVSGVVEIGFAAALVVARGFWRPRVGWVLAGYFVVIFPGNVWQAIDGTTTFGLDAPAERWGRLLLQPVLIAATLWCTGAWPKRALDPDV